MSEPTPFDIHEEKQKVEKILQSLNRRILIVIDDIDRLPVAEIYQLLRTITVLGKFPMVRYLLAFDKTVVVNTLTQSQSLPGEDILDKIVPVPVELPPPGASYLKELLSECLERFLGPAPNRFPVEALAHFIDSPRTIVRYENAVAVHLTENKTDGWESHVATVALQLFCPPAFHSNTDSIPECDREAAFQLRNHLS